MPLRGSETDGDSAELSVRGQEGVWEGAGVAMTCCQKPWAYAELPWAPCPHSRRASMGTCHSATLRASHTPSDTCRGPYKAYYTYQVLFRLSYIMPSEWGHPKTPLGLKMVRKEDPTLDKDF